MAWVYIAAKKLHASSTLMNNMSMTPVNTIKNPLDGVVNHIQSYINDLLYKFSQKRNAA